MEYMMKLHPKPFEEIKLGIKKIEVRLNDEKRVNVKVGDIIIFSKRPELKENVAVRVVERMEVKEYPGMSKYYTNEEVDKYGFVIFSIELISNDL